MKLATFVLSSIAISIQYYANKYKVEDFNKALKDLESDNGLPKIKTYDYIVVGGGTAGCVVAGRLSEHYNVLLLEAGGQPVPQSNVPFFTEPVAYDQETNYFFKSVPQQYASLRTGGIVQVSNGKMLGGSGSHNDMIHNRGSPRDFDKYAELLNDPSWKYENILQYFKAYEDFNGKLLNETESDYYGHGGPMQVDTDLPLILDKWLEAGIELGYKIADPNGFQVESFTPLAKLVHNGQRVSTYNRYIKPFYGGRENLTVLPYSVASKILIDANKYAYGVAYSRHGIPQIAHAEKEIIISCGTFLSPILLMQSGIGPQNVLNEAGVELILDLPGVGKNLNDHVYVTIENIQFSEAAIPFFSRVREEEFETVLKEYHATGAGVFGELQEGPQALVASTRAQEDNEEGWPDGRITFDGSCPTSFENDKGPSACFYITIDRAKSKGFVTLNTTEYKNGETDLTKLAIIDFKMLEESSDIEVLLEFIKLSLRIIEETTPFREIGSTYAGLPELACSEFQFRSDDYWRCYINQNSQSAIHMVGTCGGVGDDAVTDSKFRVKGVDNLRVVDASVLPTTTNSNINAAVIAISEKATNDILIAAQQLITT